MRADPLVGSSPEQHQHLCTPRPIVQAELLADSSPQQQHQLGSSSPSAGSGPAATAGQLEMHLQRSLMSGSECLPRFCL